MKATTLELKSGHVSILSHPKEVAAFIIQALASVTLTTIGCNDIIPVHPLAQGLVMVEGLVALLGSAVANRRVLEGWGWQFTEGCLDALVGFILLAHPAITIVTLPVVIGLWAIFNGLLTLSGIWSMRRRGFVQWIWVALGGAFTLLSGFITLFSPVTGMLALVLLTALTFVGAGTSSLITAYRLSRPGKATGLTLGRSVPGSVFSTF